MSIKYWILFVCPLGGNPLCNSCWSFTNAYPCQMQIKHVIISIPEIWAYMGNWMMNMLTENLPLEILPQRTHNKYLGLNMFTKRSSVHRIWGLCYETDVKCLQIQICIYLFICLFMRVLFAFNCLFESKSKLAAKRHWICAILGFCAGNWWFLRSNGHYYGNCMYVKVFRMGKQSCEGHHFSRFKGVET